MCPMFGGKKDISLFRSLNRELINRIVTTPVDIYKPSLEDNKENIYGEAVNKVWLNPVRLCCLIDYPELEMPYNEAGIMDVKQNPIFFFLFDDVKRSNLVIEVGDTIHWDDTYWTIDRVADTDQFMQKDPDTQKELMGQYTPGDWGWRYSIACYTFMTRRTRLSIEKVRSGGKTRGTAPDSLY